MYKKLFHINAELFSLHYQLSNDYIQIKESSIKPKSFATTFRNYMLIGVFVCHPNSMIYLLFCKVIWKT